MTAVSDIATFAQFARLLGVGRSYVAKLRDEGRLVLTDDGRRVRVAESRRLMAKTETGRRPDVKERHAEHRGADLPLPPPEDPAPETAPAAAPDTPDTRAYWERKDREEIARMREMERRQMEGDLVEREAVDFVLNDYGATLRGLLERLADRLSPQVYPLTTLEETHAAISEAVDDLQRELSESMKRRMEGLGQ